MSQQNSDGSSRSPAAQPTAADRTTPDAAATDIEFGTWRDLQKFVLQLSPHFEIFDGDNVRLLYPHKNEKLQLFINHGRRITETTWVLFGIRTMPANPMATAALTNTLNPVGALVLMGDYLCVNHSMPLRGLRASHVHWTLHALCETALRFRDQLGKVVHEQSGLLAQYAD